MDDQRKQLAALAANLAGATNVVPFGKYKGQPVEVMRRDQAYMDWAYGQEGIRNAYPWIFSITVNTGAEPSETPEHNRYQALFLDQAYANDVYDEIFSGQRDMSARHYDEDMVGPVKLRDIEVGFEVCREWRDGYRLMKSGPADVQLSAYYGDSSCIRIEIKPAMGDEYPAVLRQMKANQCNMLYLVRYTGSGATLQQVKKMFAMSGILVLMHEVFWEDC